MMPISEPLERCRAVPFCPGTAVAHYQVTTTAGTGVPVPCCGFHRFVAVQECEKVGWQIEFVEIDTALPN